MPPELCSLSELVFGGAFPNHTDLRDFPFYHPLYIPFVRVIQFTEKVVRVIAFTEKE